MSETLSEPWWSAYRVGMATRDGERLAINPVMVRRWEALDGIPPELSARWDRTMGKFGL